MTEVATKNDLNQLEKRLDQKIDKAVQALTGVIRDFAGQVDERFNRLEIRTDSIDNRLSNLETRVDKIEHNLDRLTNTIDDFIKRIDTFETEKAARDAQFARLERWVEQLAKETGVKLTY